MEIQAKGSFDGVFVGVVGEKLSQEEAGYRLRNHIRSGDFELYLPIDEYERPIMRLKQWQPINGRLAELNG